PSSLEEPGPRSLWPWLLAAGSLLVILLALLLQRPDRTPTAPSASAHNSQPNATGVDTSARDRLFARLPKPQSKEEPALTAEEIVAHKAAQFARSRRQLAHAMAAHFKIPVPDEFERFFEAAEAGRYDEMKAIYKSLREQRESGTDTAWYGPQWRTI